MISSSLISCFVRHGVKVRPGPRDPRPQDPGTRDPGPPQSLKVRPS